MTTKNLKTATVMLLKDPEPRGFWRNVWKALRSGQSDGGVWMQVQFHSDDDSVLTLPEYPARMWPGERMKVHCGQDHGDAKWQEVRLYEPTCRTKRNRPGQS
mgnify:CR=1 FL=1